MSGTVRVRTTVAAAMVVGITMAVGAVVLVVLLRAMLVNQVRAAAQLRADDVASVLESGGTPAALVPGAVDDELVIQIVDARGEVVASSPLARGLPPVAQLRPRESAERTLPVDDERFMVVAAAADTPAGHLTVIVARTMETASEPTAIVTVMLAVGLPLLLVVIAATTWRVVGGALAPVESMRREVDEISATELHRRVPDPPGNDEIARLARTMNRMLARLEQAQGRQHRFISDASHELRSPVAAIRQHAEVAVAHPDRFGVADLADTVLTEALRIQGLVADLLVLAKVDEHTLRLHRRSVDVDDLVFDEARRLRAKAGGMGDADRTDGTGTAAKATGPGGTGGAVGTRFRVDTTAVSAARVDGDVAALRRVLANIGDNAARHARSRVSFTLADHGETATIIVDDDGAGIPVADRQRVLERFVRLDEARARDSGGSGLGLAIASELVAAHGGSLEIADSPFGGARVEITLPGEPVESA
jgi:signal transduction histidine kinase